MPTVQDLLGAAEPALVPVHVPDPAAAIRWVATSELADPTPFLEGGELLLTTGLDTRGWDAEWDGYVARLAEAGVVAIGLAVGLSHAEAPGPLLAACREHRVNLLEVPRDTTFVAVSQTVARALDEAAHGEAQRTLASQRQLTAAALQADDVTALLAALASTGGAACVVNAEGVVETGPVGEHADLVLASTVAAEVGRIRPRGLRAAASTSTRGGTLLVHPLGLHSRPDRYLAVGFPGRPNALQRSSVATAVALLGLSVERRHTRLAADRRIRARAVEMLLHDDERTAAVLLSARPESPAAQWPGRLCVLRAAGSPDALDDALAEVEPDHLLSGLLDGELVVVVPPRDAERSATALVARGLCVGVGEPAGSQELSRSGRTAAHALALATEQSPLVSWADNVRRGVLSLVDEDRAGAFAETFLRPLARREDLLETLRSFLRHHGSQLQVATELGVHRNTVRHRVGLIEAALEESLADPQVRASAWIALQARAARE